MKMFTSHIKSLMLALGMVAVVLFAAISLSLCSLTWSRVNGCSSATYNDTTKCDSQGLLTCYFNLLLLSMLISSTHLPSPPHVIYSRYTCKLLL